MQDSGSGSGHDSMDWERMLLVYLHEAVDKAIDERNAEARAAAYATQALGRAVEVHEIESLSDGLAALDERIPIPAGIGGASPFAPKDGRLEIRHPVSSETRVLEGLELDERTVAETVAGTVAGLEDPRRRFLAVWRLLAERLERRLGSDFAALPADARVLDRSRFRHADVMSGLWASHCSEHGGALLSLSLGPVQPFIEAARTVRDLWSGSAILSWLAFRGLTPVLDRFGPTALVFPALRGNPLVDNWLRDRVGLGDLVERPAVFMRRSPSLPNRFVAMVPWGQDGMAAHEFAERCAASARDAWLQLAGDVRSVLDPALAGIDPDWAARWERQVGQHFEIGTAVLPERPLDDRALADLMGESERFEDVWPEVAAVRRLAAAFPAAGRQAGRRVEPGRWQALTEVSARLAEAQRSVRQVPVVQEDAPSPAKCSLLGTFEQMGPNGLNEGRRFWESARRNVAPEGVRLRRGERLCSIALCKRFAAPATLRRKLGLDVAEVRFPDTATVAAAEWLRSADMEHERVRSWSGRWLHQRSRTEAEDDEPPPPPEVWERIQAARRESRPPSYYAVLMMDADNLGHWLGGGKAPTVREILHPEALRRCEELGEAARSGLDAHRPVDPAFHLSISEALNAFATRIAPEVIRRHSGTTIYSGGDDLLALLPARSAVSCARELERRFRGLAPEGAGPEHSAGDAWSAMGRRATMSAGIAFVHFMEDLRLALQAARDAEAAAKSSGRNVLAMRFMRRSGEHAQALLGWDMAPWFQEVAELFGSGASDRWTYRLRAELPALSGRGIPEPAIRAEIGRLVDRARRGSSATGPDGAAASAWWDRFLAAEGERHRHPGAALDAFVTLCQGAAFVARAHDA